VKVKSIRSRAPAASSDQVRRVMQANYGDELSPERILRNLIYRSGFRYRKNFSPITGFRCKADLVFLRLRLCVFIDGCFWHGCPLHFQCPKQNGLWWQEKISETVARDTRQAQQLRSHGWHILRIWEHEIRENAQWATHRVLKELNDLEAGHQNVP